MKKLFLVAIATVGFAFSASAQDTKMKVGVDFGLPMGDIKDSASFNLGVNAAYLWNVGEGFDVGAGLSYNTYFAKEYDVPGFGKIKPDDSSFLPVYGTASYSITDNIFAGADLGYAIVLAPSEADGGVYYQPKVGYQAEAFEVFVGYKAVAVSGGSFTSLNLGFNYKF